MTTVVFKDGVFAADSLVTADSYTEGYTNKVRRVGNIYIGWAGNLCALEEFLKFIAGEPFNRAYLEDKESRYDFIVVNKETREVTEYNRNLIPTRLDMDYYAIGSGRSLAIGALLMGASPKKAVEIASKVDRTTGGKITVTKVW